MTYTPQPGTIPYRVIEYLKIQPRGLEFSSAALAEAIGHDGAGLRSCLAIPLEHGALKADKRVPPLGGKATLFWSLGDGTPLPKPDDYEPDQPLSKPPTMAAAPQASKPAADTVIKRKKPAAKTPAQVPKLAPAPEAPQQRWTFGWFSDGSLVIRRPGAEDIQLSTEDTTDLVNFVIRQVRG